MSQNQVMFFTSPDELKLMLSETVKDVFETYKEELIELHQKKDQEELLSIRETSRMFKVTEATIINWKRDGHLPYHRVASKTFFKKSEVMDALQMVRENKKEGGAYGN